MNERIKQLAVQAFRDTALYGGKRGDKDFDQRYNEMFAELLIKECGQWFNDRLVVEPDHGLSHRIERNRAVVGVMKEYNAHFGVEE